MPFHGGNGNSTKLSQNVGSCAQAPGFLRLVGRSFLVFGVTAAALAVQVFVQLVSRVMQITFIYDVVPFENAPGLVTADEHGKLFGDPGAYKIPDAGSPQVMEKPVNTGFPHGLLPCLSDVHHLTTTPCGLAL